jgi:hypothetical protein
MSYWDSSTLLKLYVQEPDSAEFRALAAKASRVTTGSLEPSSKSILNSALVSKTDFTLPPGGIVAGSAVFIFMFD